MSGQPFCLVLMPMYAGFEEIRASVARAIRQGGFQIVRLEVEIQDSAWHMWLLDAVETCDLALVDLTDHNPFVAYELGCVHQRQLPTAFIINARERRLPATVRGAVCTPYGEGCHHFEEDIVDHLRQLHCSRKRPPSCSGSSQLYSAAVAASEELMRATGMDLVCVDKAEFHTRLTVAHRRGAPGPHTLAGQSGMRSLLSLVLDESDRTDVMRAINDWSAGRYSKQGRRAMGAR